MRKICRKILLSAAAAALLVMLAAGLTASKTGALAINGSSGAPLPEAELSTIPPSVIEDAQNTATELFGDAKNQYDAFVNELLSFYQETRDKNFVVVFNAGGWGTSLIETSSGWLSILNGLQAELIEAGQESLIFTYRRTQGTAQSKLGEVLELLRGYPHKAEQLAARVEFLTSNNPHLNVIITGESLGTLISEQTMKLLDGEPHVISIQTGPPFWYKDTSDKRTLLMRDNGIIPDTFSEGNIIEITRANIEDWLGLSSEPIDNGYVLNFIKAPGHDYRWQYPAVNSRVTGFIEDKLGIDLTN